MTKDTRTLEATPRKMHSAVLRRGSEASTAFLLTDEELRFAADCERMRVDRNGSVLSVLLVRLNHQDSEALAFFSRVLEGRLRVTDTPGLLADGRVAVLLPDTPAEGAWKVAADISEVYPPGPGRPECDVVVYPDGRDRNTSNPHDDTDDAERGDSEKEVAGSGAKHQGRPSDEFFFARAQPLWKRTLDVAGGTVGLIASLPILFVAAVAVKASSRGPVFFSQLREGHGGKHFKIWKLRTMHVNAENEKQQLRQYSQQDGPAFKMKKDPRTTAVGRFLRWTSMDELPQFWNVIKGEMSLVGPRPLPIEESAACHGWQRRRLQVLPGMTCTWQVSERGNVSFDEWVRMDLRYAKKRSIAADVRLLVMTLPSLLMQRGMR